MGKIDSSVRVGRTIAGEWEKQESESERLATRKREKTKKIIKTLILIAILGSIGVIVAMEVSVWVSNRVKEESEVKVAQPTIEIIDESGTGITTRMKEYVAQIEKDYADIGLSANRAVVPVGKMREVHIFLNGYDYYVKLNIDKGTAVSAEDTKRMVDYLVSRDIHPEYIDVRVEGKGYYK